MNKPFILFLIIGLLFVSGCVDVKEPEEEGELLLSQEDYTNCNIYLDGYSSTTLSQNFKIDARKLTKAEFIATGSGNKKVILHLREDSIYGSEITNMTKNINDTLKDKWVEWDFPDIIINSSKTYFFVFECPECAFYIGIPEGYIPESQIICFWYANTEIYPKGNYWLNNESEKDRDMAFKLFGIK